MSGNIEAIRKAVHEYPGLIVARDRPVHPNAVRNPYELEINQIVKLGRIMRVAPRIPIMMPGQFFQFSAEFLTSVVGEENFNLGYPGIRDIHLPSSTILESIIQVITSTSSAIKILDPVKAALVDDIQHPKPSAKIKNYCEALTIVVYPELALAELYGRAFRDVGKRFDNNFDFEPLSYMRDFRSLDRIVEGELFQAWQRGADLFNECYPDDICSIGEITK